MRRQPFRGGGIGTGQSGEGAQIIDLVYVQLDARIVHNVHPRSATLGFVKMQSETSWTEMRTKQIRR